MPIATFGDDPDDEIPDDDLPEGVALLGVVPANTSMSISFTNSSTPVYTNLAQAEVYNVIEPAIPTVDEAVPTYDGSSGGDDLVYLDPQYALERALMGMVEVSRRKRADYAVDGDEFSNFRAPAEFAGFEAAWMSALFTVVQKLERIRALRANGRLDDPQNEAVSDTLLDIAVYAVLAHAMHLEDQQGQEG